MEAVRPSGVVAFCTDFGHADPCVGVMKGVVLRQAPKAVLVDLCHAVPPQAVAVGALFLGGAIERFPAGTVHVAVVDPGVGTARRALAVLARGCYWLGPDNGVLTPLLDERAEVRAIDADRLGLRPGATFHGRDVFAPVAGWLCSGRYGFQALGPRVTEPVRLPPAAPGTVVHVDGYGNLITNLPGSLAVGLRGLRLQDHFAPLASTYAMVETGALVTVVNSYDLLEVAVRDGSAARRLGAARGDVATPVTGDQE